MRETSIPSPAQDSPRAVDNEINRSIFFWPRIISLTQKVTLAQLKKLGYSANAVFNGTEALQALARTHYDIILMDCQMPEMDGHETTQRDPPHRGGPAAYSIIALTANAMAGERERCLAGGMDDYISKPVGLEQLSRALGRWASRITSPVGNNAAWQHYA